MKLLAFVAAAMLALAPVASQARADDDIAKHLVNEPGGWVVYGKQTNKKVKDGAVQGGAAMEVKAEGSGNPWEAAAHTEINQKITKGDKLVCVVWLKGKNAADTSVRVHARVQVNAAPYDGLSETDFNISNEWKMYTLEATADKDYDKGNLVFVIHLNTAKQTIYLGPAFVLNMTRTY